MAKFLCEKASEANPDAHCRIRNVLINDRRLAKDPVQDVSLWGVLTAESSTPSLEFDYFGNSEKDLPIWKVSKKIIYTNVSNNLRKLINTSELSKIEIKEDFK